MMPVRRRRLEVEVRAVPGHDLGEAVDCLHDAVGGHVDLTADERLREHVDTTAAPEPGLGEEMMSVGRHEHTPSSHRSPRLIRTDHEQ